MDPGKGQQRLTVVDGLLRRLGVVRPKLHRAWFHAFASACIMLISLTACGSAATSSLVPPGFTGYDWQVSAISHDGVETSIPARLHVALQFGPYGQFSANDSVNMQRGDYRATSDGFTTSWLGGTGAGYAGHDPAVLLAVSAIASFDNDDVRATVKLTADRLVVDVASYTLTCQRLGPAAPWPTPPPMPVG
jgi:hypothetical protein